MDGSTDGSTMQGIGGLSLPDEFAGDFSGVLTAHRDGVLVEGWALGLADRSLAVPNTFETRFGLASITKTFTAAAVLSLVADGTITLDTTARSILGADLPLIADDVTIDQLLTHRSGIGDYLDEEIDDLAPLPIPVQQLDSVEAYVPLVDGFETAFPAGERFAYCNGGFVVLGILAERASGIPYGELITRRVFEPAGMTSADLARSDAPEPHTATGYRDDGTTNVFHLPVVGVGDGGAHAASADLDAFWRALYDGRLLPERLVAAMVEEVTEDAEDGRGYGRGVWIDGDLVSMAGGDHGVSALSSYDPVTRITVTALANVDTRTLRRITWLRSALARVTR